MMSWPIRKPRCWPFSGRMWVDALGCIPSAKCYGMYTKPYFHRRTWPPCMCWRVVITHDWLQYQQLEHDQAQLIAEAERLVPASRAAVLLSVPGISPYHAARYLALVGDVERFASADHLWAFARFDPVYQQSGDSRWVGHLSKRGDPAFRDTLYLIGQSTARHCPPIQQAFRRAYRGQRRRRVLATIRAAHKANRL